VFVSKYAPRGAPDRRRLEELVGERATLREIAAELDRSIATVRYWLDRWDIRREDARKKDYDPATAPREALRLCRRHGVTAFVLEGRGSYRCKRCRQERVAGWRRQVKATLVAEAGGHCLLCGYGVCPAALQFHHLDPGTKSFALSHDGVTRSLARARQEATKCVLLCANCHAEVEAGVRVLEAPRGGFEPPRTD
jgi:hypothetical protein